MASFDSPSGQPIDDKDKSRVSPGTRTPLQGVEQTSASHSVKASDTGLERLGELSQPLPAKIVELRAQRLEERQKSEQHWFRKAVKAVGGFLWGNPVSTVLRAATWSITSNLAKLAWWCTKAVSKFAFSVALRPALNLVWNNWTSKLSKFAWRALPSPLLDLAMHNAESLKHNRVVTSLYVPVKNALGAVWNHGIARAGVFVIKKTAMIAHWALFLGMEGAWPPHPMTAARHIQKSWGRVAAPSLYYGSMVAGTALFGAMAIAGTMGVGSALLWGPLLVPTVAAGLNRAVMFCATPCKSEKFASKNWLNFKFNKAFWDMEGAQDAFDYKLVKDKDSGEPVDFYLAPASIETYGYIEKRLGFSLASKQSVAGLVDYVVNKAHDLQSESGEEFRIKRFEVLEMATADYERFETKPEHAAVFYPNGRLTVAAYREVEQALLELNPEGLQKQRSTKLKAKYLSKLVETIEAQLIEQHQGEFRTLSLSENFCRELRSRMVPEAGAGDVVSSSHLIVRELERKDFRPNPAEFLIVSGQILGGIASAPMTPVTIAGHLVKAGGKLLFSNNSVERLGLDDLRDFKNEIDVAIENANSGDEVLIQAFRMSRVLLRKLEDGVRPFASEIGLAIANSIVINAPYVAQQEMEALNNETETHFVVSADLEALEEGFDSLSESERRQLIEHVEQFLTAFGDEIVMSDLPLARHERKWFHYVPSIILYPRRVAKALLESVGTIAGGDSEARKILKGLRLYFEDRGIKFAADTFDRARSAMNRLEQFLELDSPNTNQ